MTESAVRWSLSSSACSSPLLGRVLALGLVLVRLRLSRRPWSLAVVTARDLRATPQASFASLPKSLLLISSSSPPLVRAHLVPCSSAPVVRRLLRRRPLVGGRRGRHVSFFGRQETTGERETRDRRQQTRQNDRARLAMCSCADGGVVAIQRLALMHALAVLFYCTDGATGDLAFGHRVFTDCALLRRLWLRRGCLEEAEAVDVLDHLVVDEVLDRLARSDQLAAAGTNTASNRATQRLVPCLVHWRRGMGPRTASWSS